nr:MAG TPA: hypothetical protein [Caudoviricetes sp.]
MRLGTKSPRSLCIKLSHQFYKERIKVHTRPRVKPLSCAL